MRCARCGFDSSDLWAVLPVVITLLQREGRVTYRALKREFGFDDALLEALREELIFAKQVASDEEGKVLVWSGEKRVAEQPAATATRSATGATLDPGASCAPMSLPPIATETDSSIGSQPHGPMAAASTGLTGFSTRALAVNEAQRRQLTVVFCDLVGSTALSHRLDPEDLRELVQAYQETAATVITRYEGHIAQYLGDGLLIYFGYPKAHEDDAQRAVRASLEVVEAVQTLNARIEPEVGVRLAVRLGIHTGLVVVGEIGGGERHEQLALGETPNVAARIQSAAEPDTVVISAATARLVHGMFALQDLGARHLKGLEGPIVIARVLNPLEEKHDEDGTSLEAVRVLVGRDEEIGLLRRRWEQSKEGLGQVVLINGDAGIGKTALVQGIRTYVRQEGATRIQFRCSPYHQNSALYPVIDHLQHLLHWQRDESAANKLDKLERLLQTYRFPQPETVPLFAALLSLPLPDGRYSPLDLPPQQQKQRIHDALAAWLMEETERQPVLATWEDLQWADPSSLELLGLVIDQTPTVRMLNVLTFRPDFVPPWPARTHMTPFTLNRLERPQVEAMVTQLAGGNALPSEVVHHIINKTDGVPLFIEELTKTVLESDILTRVDGHYELKGPLSLVTIPATLQDSLMARLDRLPQVREIAQLGAVLGREFAYEMLKALATIEEETLQERLAQLVAAELFYQRGRPPRAKYVFKHALIQDTAYASLLRSTRQHYHKQIAQLFEHQFPEMVETQPEVVAHHYTEAGCPELAISYWQRAGHRAVQLSANTEAISHLTKGLQLLATLPATPEQARRELDLQTTLGPALMTTRGFAAPEVAQTYSRARELCVQLGETAQLAPALLGLSTFRLTRGEFEIARELGEQLLSLGQSAQDSALVVEAHSVLGTTLFHLGELTAAREHLEQGIAVYDPRQHRFLAFRYGQDPGVFCLCYMVRLLWFLGYPDQALTRSQEAIALAHQISHPFSLASAYTFAALVSQLRREGRATQEWAEKAIAVCTEHGFAFYSAMGTILQGWALVEQGHGAEGIARIRQGLTAWRATGSELFRPHLLALLAEAHGRVGEATEGLAVLSDALAAAHKSGKRFYAAELYRLQGELILASHLTTSRQDVQAKKNSLSVTILQADAEAYLQQALDIARQRGAKSWELRAATSMARLWQRQGQKGAARQLLSEIYQWFTEGFDTKDLQEAKALLEELTQEHGEFRP